MKPTFVVDANVAVAWTITLPYSPAANRLLRAAGSLIAPDLLVAEVANAFHVLSGNSSSNHERLQDGLELLPRWFSELVPSGRLRREAFELARQLDHPAYDCFYLALALLREVQFVTSNERFQRKAVSAGYGASLVLLDKWFSA